MKGMAVGEGSFSNGKTWLLALLLGALAASCGGSTKRDDDNNPSNQSMGGSGGTESFASGAGGTAAGGGTSSTGGTTSFGGTAPLPEGSPEAVDLLLVVDNSISMGQKQALLTDSIPRLVNLLANSACLDEAGELVEPLADGTCEFGEVLFPPQRDIHIGIVTSSLGSHGGDVCSAPIDPTAHLDDHAQLVASLRGLPSWNDMGFLAWDPDANANSPPGDAVLGDLVSKFQDHLASVGETGCGYEATLEAWYRFLVDPDPPQMVVKEGSVTVKSGIDETVLAQRDAFLRPESLVYIVMLTDENDCSILDEGQGWLVGYYDGAFRMPRATAACASDPNSPCCRSCATAEPTPPDGCASLSADPECSQGTSLDALSDDLNLRCYEQKRRFGFDLLYPIERYKEGLTSAAVPDRSGTLVPNPLLAPRGDSLGRHPSRVVLGGIVGVPWQDIADEASLTGEGLRFLSASELEDQGRWDVILGDPTNLVPPSDPLMLESVDPRTGTNPILNAPLAPADSTNPQANPINGHEHFADNRTDLQYACIFELPDPRLCSDPVAACQCREGDLPKNRALCQPPGGGTAGTTQYYDKAYPGIRHLDLLRRMGKNAVVGSICPKIPSDETHVAYGYNPFVQALIGQTQHLLRGK